ncbi:MAG: DUF4249 domain-containing protein [Bacteroidota bacterium]
MNNFIKYLIVSTLAIYSLSACEDVIQVDVPKNEEKLVVDAQLNDGGGVQNIKLMVSQAYFDNKMPPPAIGAVVEVIDNEGNRFEFVQKLDSLNKPTINYEIIPNTGNKFGKIGNIYTLSIKYNGETYTSTTKLNRVPAIDSLIYVFKDNSDNLGGEEDEPKKGFRPEFFARDLMGIGDCYYIKGYRYDKEKKKWELEREEPAYDAAFQPGARADGLVFILPLRRAIGSQLFNEGDSSRVELYSVSQAHFDFLRAAENEENNQGLFATPPATFPTNILNANSSSKKKALGWFSVSGLSKMTVVIDPKLARKDTD